MKELALKYDDFVAKLNESRINEDFVVTRRKRSGRPAEYVNTSAPVRSKILGFISEKEKVTKKELMEYFDTLAEELGRKPNPNWLKANSHLVDTDVNENGEKVFTLTKRGKRILDIHKKYESSMTAELEEAKSYLKENGINEIDESKYTDEKQIHLINKFKEFEIKLNEQFEDVPDWDDEDEIVEDDE